MPNYTPAHPDPGRLGSAVPAQILRRLSESREFNGTSGSCNSEPICDAPSEKSTVWRALF